ncbi:hypothetical protein HK102_006029, partial [Quaeritorhiza haematococci]
MSILSWFKRNETDYEKILAELDDKIRSSELRLSEILVSERKVVSAWLTYSIGGFTLYIIFRFLFLSYSPQDSWENWLYFILFILAGPVGIWGGRMMLQGWYRSSRRYEELELKNLRGRKKQKLEELKIKTDYYRNKAIIERHEENVNKPRQPPATDVARGRTLHQAHGAGSGILRQRPSSVPPQGSPSIVGNGMGPGNRF